MKSTPACRPEPFTRPRGNAPGITSQAQQHRNVSGFLRRPAKHPNPGRGSSSSGPFFKTKSFGECRRNYIGIQPGRTGSSRKAVECFCNLVAIHFDSMGRMLRGVHLDCLLSAIPCRSASFSTTPSCGECRWNYMLRTSWSQVRLLPGPLLRACSSVVEQARFTNFCRRAFSHGPNAAGTTF